jgi:alpha-mannosidase II
MEGHLWLQENLHVKPQNSWSIDPFGHSGTIPYLLKKSGINNMVIQRIHQATKGALASVKSLEYYWHQYWDTAGQYDILCHVMPYMLYSVQFTCGPDPFVCFQFDFRHSDNPD